MHFRRDRKRTEPLHKFPDGAPQREEKGYCLKSVNVSGTCVNFGIVKIVPQDMAIMRTEIEFGLELA